MAAAGRTTFMVAESEVEEEAEAEAAAAAAPVFTV